MNTEALLRKTVHPPCTEEHEIVEIVLPADRTRLSLGDRLALRIGLWLTLRAQRSRPRRTPRAQRAPVSYVRTLDRGITEHEAITLLSFPIQRGLR
ncbi:hypothetical protein [Microbacterium soli]|uniref:Uncharacterized protein n=1 Tax=Microbacterium soli TaxID=446075 RepID=A0ABP7NFS4_9MICO